MDESALTRAGTDHGSAASVPESGPSGSGPAEAGPTESVPTQTLPPVDPARGLSAAEVAERVREGRVNTVPEGPGRTIGQIIRANVLTPVNFIIGTLWVLMMIAMPGADALFVGVVVLNSIVGVTQELRARRALRQLAVLSAPKARLVRDGAVAEQDVGSVVADDVVDLQPGDQVVVDGEVLEARGLELNESLLTGESDPVHKRLGDEVLSGSFVAAGSGRYRATRVGGEAYAAKLAEEAKRFSLTNSELQGGVNRILKWLMVVVPPVAILLLIDQLNYYRQTEGGNWREAVRGAVAAAVSMVPDGLVLLTSVAFIAGVLVLAKRRALAKELASVELLARVSVLCLDKTGTITTGEISLSAVEPVDGVAVADLDQALGALAGADPNPNATLEAIARVDRPPVDWKAREVVPFSSARKWSGASFAEQGTWILGAPEIVVDPADPLAEAVRARVAQHASQGRRVVCVAHAPGLLVGDTLPEGRRVRGLVLLEDQVRPDARQILGYFLRQGVRLKVISGDHPATVAAVARRAGVPGAGDGYDARALPEDPEALADVLEHENVFGRVTPHQKRAMVKALQSRGEVVAMTGDGVNDVLALKDADMGIAMGAGSPATRSVAQLVLLDNRFSTLPTVLAEGRKVINNMERVANLFVTKTSYAVLLALATALTRVEYPYYPRHLTLIGAFSIGVPGFILALAPNARRSRPGFVKRVIHFSVPAGLVVGVTAFLAFRIARFTLDLDPSVALDQARSAATLVLLSLGLVVLAKLSRPLVPWKVGLIASMLACYAVVLLVPFLREFFALVWPDPSVWVLIVASWAVGTLVLVVGPLLIPWWGVGDSAQAMAPERLEAPTDAEVEADGTAADVAATASTGQGAPTADRRRDDEAAPRDADGPAGR